MSSIKQKVGYCVDCPEGSSPKHLQAKRCTVHYSKHRREVNALKPSNVAKAAVKKANGTFIKAQVPVMPHFCENCSNPLPSSPPWLVKACVAHILPKRPDYGFPSVACHPMNKVFLCPDCHSNMDSQGESFIRKMKVYPELVRRVSFLIPCLPPAELNRVPVYFLTS